MEAAASVRSDFALEVLRLLENGRAEAALELAADGVRSYPTYVGGYAVLADCYAALDDIDDAFVILTEAERRFPGRRTLEQRRTRYQQRATVEPSTVEPSTVEPSTVEPSTVEPTTVEPTTVEPTTVEPPTERLIPRRRRERAPVVPQERKESPLRVIELGAAPADDRVIRSASMRLIPGLEYTSLRFEGQRRSGRSISALPEPPTFRTFNQPAPRPKGMDEPEKPRKVSLEELADRIGKVRITAEDLEKKPPAPDPLAERPKRALVTETLANIYLQQQSFDKAIDAFTQLKELHPDKAEHFQAMIDKATAARDNAS